MVLLILGLGEDADKRLKEADMDKIDIVEVEAEMLGQPVFPVQLTTGRTAPGVTISLHADGSWSGDGQAFLEAAAELQGYQPNGSSVLLWLVMNAIRTAPRHEKL